MNVQCAKVGKPAQDTLPAKRAHKFKFSFPVSWVLVNRVAVLVPVIFLTLRRAISPRRSRAAVFALPAVCPTRGKIAGLTAKLSKPAFDSIERGFKSLFTVSTVYGNACLFHGSNIAHFISRVKLPKYCQIAVERMERELAQPCLPTMEPERAKQEVLI